MGSLKQEMERAVDIATRKAEGNIRQIILGLERDTLSRVGNECGMYRFDPTQKMRETQPHGK